jgi:hypothetical protein
VQAPTTRQHVAFEASLSPRSDSNSGQDEDACTPMRSLSLKTDVRRTSKVGVAFDCLGRTSTSGPDQSACCRRQSAGGPIQDPGSEPDTDTYSKDTASSIESFKEIKADEANVFHHGVPPTLALPCMGAVCSRCLCYSVLDVIQCRSQVLSG